MGLAWQVLTGEFPPVPGGVSDYTAQIAPGLARAGGSVHVWTTHPVGLTPETSSPATGVNVHRFAPDWSRAALDLLSEQLNAWPAPRTILVQYTPNAWGCRGANFGFGRWLLERRRIGDRIWAMVHELFYPWRLWDKPSRWLLAFLHRQMMRQLLRASDQVFLSTSTFEKILAPFAPHHNPPDCKVLPIPSNIPVVDAPERVVEQRQRSGAEGAMLLGSFGTYSPLIKAPLRRLIPQLLRQDNRQFLMLGRGSEQFARELFAAEPHLAGRVLAAGDLSAAELSIALQSLDLLIQPYPDGATTRRTSLMAGLAHGLPVVTNIGFLSEPLWAATGSVRTAPAGDVAGMAVACEGLLASLDDRQRLGAAARRLYDEQFSVERTVERLLAAAR